MVIYFHKHFKVSTVL